jgi:peptidoglycan/xylan/chitin deacetylase (PgdA/CDA1 family)
MQVSNTIINSLALFFLLVFEYSCIPPSTRISDRPIVVLTFDDAVKSHRSFVAPLLQQYDFDATFFVTYAWMDDTINFMNWKDISDLHEMGFEIGNHSWTHADFSQPKMAFELEGELGMVEWLLDQQGISKPVSYAHTGNAFGPEAIAALNKLGYRFARRGKQPEVEYGSMQRGPGFDPDKHHPLLIPTTIDFYPGMNLDLFQKALDSVPSNEIPILQFHGVPDSSHPWVSTPEEDFRT